MGAIMTASKTKGALALLLGSFCLMSCSPGGDCGDSSWSNEIGWGGIYEDYEDRGRRMTIDGSTDQVRVEWDDPERGRVVATWKIRTAEEYRAARRAASPR